MASQNLDSINFELKDKIDGKSPLIGALFLFFLLSFTFMFVYFLYICTDRHRRRGDPQPQATGLDPTTLNGLPVFSYGSSCNKRPRLGAECAICLSVFQEGDMVKVLPICRHGLHSDCVDKWLMTHSSCPLCRACIHRVDPLSQGRNSEIP